MNSLKNILIVVLILIIIGFAWEKWKHNPNDTVVLPQTTQPSTVITLDDSTKGLLQSVRVANDINTIRSLQNEKQLLLAQLAKLKPELVVQYRESFTQGQINGVLTDSLDHAITELLELHNSVTVTKDSFEIYKKAFLEKERPFEISDNKWRFEKGTFSLNGKIRSDSLRIISKPSLTFGEKTGFLKRPVLSVLVSNENPFIKADSITSVKYIPKQRIQPSFTLIGLSDGKSTTIGAGINIKKGIISLTLGYTLLNKQF